MEPQWLPSGNILLEQSSKMQQLDLKVNQSVFLWAFLPALLN